MRYGRDRVARYPSGSSGDPHSRLERIKLIQSGPQNRYKSHLMPTSFSAKFGLAISCWKITLKGGFDIDLKVCQSLNKNQKKHTFQKRSLRGNHVRSYDRPSCHRIAWWDAKSMILVVKHPRTRDSSAVLRRKIRRRKVSKGDRYQLNIPDLDEFTRYFKYGVMEDEIQFGYLNPISTSRWCPRFKIKFEQFVKTRDQTPSYVYWVLTLDLIDSRSVCVCGGGGVYQWQLIRSCSC